MEFLRAGMRLFLWLAISHVILAETPHVTATKLVDAGKGQELLRKINGRWWSQDNREVYPPSKDGVFWELDSKPGTCDFYHHRPFQLDSAESLRLFMKKEEVEATLGPPNRIFGRDDHSFWYYYASNGIKLTVRFMDDGVLGEANYDTVGEKSWPVGSIERELAGRSIYKLLSERASKRSDEWLAKQREVNRIDTAARSEALRRGIRSSTLPALRGVRPSVVAVAPVPVPRAAEPAVPAKKRIISSEAVASVSPGTTRDDVLMRLGEPNSRFAITGDEGVRESFKYDLDSKQVEIRLVDGEVVGVR